MGKLLTLKIGRHKYEITEKDKFMDNKFCVQLLTQSKEKSSWGHTPNPVLSQRAIKEIKSFERIEFPNEYETRVSTFTLRGVE